VGIRASWVIGLTLTACLILAAAVAAAAIGRRRSRHITDELTARLLAGRIPVPVTRFDRSELQDLPPPVRRYFELALQDGQAMVTAALLEQSGTIDLSSAGVTWNPFLAQHTVLVHRPGFLWTASISASRGLPLQIHEGYLLGEGILRTSLAGLFKVTSLEGQGELARGELIRFLAEAPWYPTALLPSQGVRWSAVDAYSAEATLDEGPLSVGLLFRFNEAGMIDSVLAGARGRKVDNTVTMTPWECRWSDYQLRDGMQIPMRSEAAWWLPEGRLPYWRGHLVSIILEVQGLTVRMPPGASARASHTREGASVKAAR
jgi:hypothetical protein